MQMQRRRPQSGNHLQPSTAARRLRPSTAAATTSTRVPSLNAAVHHMQQQLTTAAKPGHVVLSSPPSSRPGALDDTVSSTGSDAPPYVNCGTVAADHLERMYRVLTSGEIAAVAEAFYQHKDGYLTPDELPPFLSRVGIAAAATASIEATVWRALAVRDNFEAMRLGRGSEIAASTSAVGKFRRPKTAPTVDKVSRTASLLSGRRFSGGAAKTLLSARSSLYAAAVVPPALQGAVVQQPPPPPLPSTLSLEHVLWICRTLKDDHLQHLEQQQHQILAASSSTAVDAASASAQTFVDTMEAFMSCADEASGVVTRKSVLERCRPFGVQLSSRTAPQHHHPSATVHLHTFHHQVAAAMPTSGDVTPSLAPTDAEEGSDSDDAIEAKPLTASDFAQLLTASGARPNSAPVKGFAGKVHDAFLTVPYTDNELLMFRESENLSQAAAGTLVNDVVKAKMLSDYLLGGSSGSSGSGGGGGKQQRALLRHTSYVGGTMVGMGSKKSSSLKSVAMAVSMANSVHGHSSMDDTGHGGDNITDGVGVTDGTVMFVDDSPGGKDGSPPSHPYAPFPSSSADSHSQLHLAADGMQVAGGDYPEVFRSHFLSKGSLTRDTSAAGRASPVALIPTSDCEGTGLRCDRHDHHLKHYNKASTFYQCTAGKQSGAATAASGDDLFLIPDIVVDAAGDGCQFLIQRQLQKHSMSGGGGRRVKGGGINPHMSLGVGNHFTFSSVETSPPAARPLRRPTSATSSLAPDHDDSRLVGTRLLRSYQLPTHSRRVGETFPSSVTAAASLSRPQSAPNSSSAHIPGYDLHSFVARVSATDASCASHVTAHDVSDVLMPTNHSTQGSSSMNRGQASILEYALQLEEERMKGLEDARCRSRKQTVASVSPTSASMKGEDLEAPSDVSTLGFGSLFLPHATRRRVDETIQKTASPQRQVAACADVTTANTYAQRPQSGAASQSRTRTRESLTSPHKQHPSVEVFRWQQQLETLQREQKESVVKNRQDAVRQLSLCGVKVGGSKSRLMSH